MISILLLAAGASSRMRGGDKLLETVEDVPLLRLMAQRALGVSDSVIVCLSALDGPRAATLQDLPITKVLAEDADQGMAHSLCAGVRATPTDAQAVMVVPADMPELTRNDLQKIENMSDANPSAIIRGMSAHGVPGHPVVFPRTYFDELLDLRGDQGAKSLLKTHAAQVMGVALPAQHALTDLDTPEQWDMWRREANKPK